MAPGYLIAAFCEFAGVLGLLAVLAMNRAERQAKASGLRGVLRSGRPASAPSGLGTKRRQRAIPVRAVRLPAVPVKPRDPTGPESAARTALQRAIPRTA